MIIKIPSKNIYEIQNPKVRDNVVDNVSVDLTNVAPNNEYEVSLANQAISTEFTTDEIENKSDTKYGYDQYADSETIDRYYTCAKIENTIKYKKGSITIPISQPNKYISKLQKRITTQDGSEKDEPIQYSIRGNKSYATTSATWNYDTGYGFEITNISMSGITVEEGVVLDIPQLQIVVEEKNRGASSIVSSIPHPTIIKTTKDTTNDCYIVEYDILGFLEYYTYKGQYTTVGKYETGFSTTLSGEYVKYEPTAIELTIYGNTIGISIEDGSITYIKDASGNVVQGTGKRPFSLEGNELLQDGTTTNGVPTTQWLAENVLSQYKTGKETATIKCGINDYYDTDGNKVITPNGKNLLTMPYVYETYESEGISFKANTDGSVSISGTHNSTHYVSMPLKVNWNLPKGSYFVSGGNVADNIYMQVSIKKKDGTTRFVVGSFYVDDGELVNVYATTNIPQNTTIDNYIVYPMLNKGVKAVPYEPILPMTIHTHDKVIPYVYSVGGVDKPMSLLKDGSPKVFEVVGISAPYGGAIFQNIYLQEIDTKA